MILSKRPSAAVSAALALSLAPVVPTGANRALAGEAASCHFHGKEPASEETVKRCSLDRVALLIKKKKIPEAWSSTRVDQIAVEAVAGKKGDEWKASIRNPEVLENGVPKVLYLFFTHQGNFIAANFTGK